MPILLSYSAQLWTILIHNRIKTKTDSVLNQLIHFELKSHYFILYFRKRLTTVGWLIPNIFAISYVV